MLLFAFFSTLYFVVLLRLFGRRRWEFFLWYNHYFFALFSYRGWFSRRLKL